MNQTKEYPNSVRCGKCCITIDPTVKNVDGKGNIVCSKCKSVTFVLPFDYKETK